MTKDDQKPAKPLDAVWLFENGLEDLVKYFEVDSENTEKGVVLKITGVKRIEAPDGSWYLLPEGMKPLHEKQ